MFTLQKDILEIPWGSPIDEDYKAVFENDDVLKLLVWKLNKLSPYDTKKDTLFNDMQVHFSKMNKELTETDINEAYKQLHWFIQIHSHLVEILTVYKNNVKKIELITDIITSYKKIELEIQAKGSIKKLYENREKALDTLDKNYPDKKNLTTIESKFIQMRMAGLDKELDTKISFLTWQKLTNSIFAKITSDKYINELKRKTTILNWAVEYVEKLYKTTQEQINGYKKIIDNLMFLYDNAG